jgi:hypothetical protein
LSADQIDRIALEDLVVSDGNALVVDDEIRGAGELAAPARKGTEQPVEAS